MRRRVLLLLEGLLEWSDGTPPEIEEGEEARKLSSLEIEVFRLKEKRMISKFCNSQEDYNLF